MTLTLYLVTGALFLASALIDREKTRQALQMAGKSAAGILPTALGMIGLIGLILALVPTESIGTLFGSGGVGGLLAVSLVGAITMIPAFVAFPLAASLLRAGAGFGEIATFITTLTMVGVVTAPMEAQFFGRRFTVTRNLLSYALALVVGLLIGGILQ